MKLSTNVRALMTSFSPPVPSVEIRLGLPGEGPGVGPLRAFVDTGADGTIVPMRIMRQLDLHVDERRYIRSHWGEPRSVAMYRLDLALGASYSVLPYVQVVGDARGNEIILGRNVLNKLVLVLNGPKETLEVRG